MKEGSSSAGLTKPLTLGELVDVKMRRVAEASSTWLRWGTARCTVRCCSSSTSPWTSLTSTSGSAAAPPLRHTLSCAQRTAPFRIVLTALYPEVGSGPVRVSGCGSSR
eukprot:scaffold46483_cov69-Phaeocystis_antarctica.AAC.2